jgi:hypothetical protein
VIAAGKKKKEEKKPLPYVPAPAPYVETPRPFTYEYAVNDVYTGASFSKSENQVPTFLYFLLPKILYLPIAHCILHIMLCMYPHTYIHSIIAMATKIHICTLTSLSSFPDLVSSTPANGNALAKPDILNCKTPKLKVGECLAVFNKGMYIHT